MTSWLPVTPLHFGRLREPTFSWHSITTGPCRRSLLRRSVHASPQPRGGCSFASHGGIRLSSSQAEPWRTFRNELRRSACNTFSGITDSNGRVDQPGPVHRLGTVSYTHLT